MTYQGGAETPVGGEEGPHKHGVGVHVIGEPFHQLWQRCPLVDEKEDRTIYREGKVKDVKSNRNVDSEEIKEMKNVRDRN